MGRHRQANRLQPERLIPKALSMPKRPTSQPTIALTARFVAVLYASTQGRSGRWRRIGDCAERAGIKGADVERAVRIAEKAGLLVMHIDELQVMLTAKGLEVAQPERKQSKR